MRKITIWGWGDDYKAAKINSEACIKKMWKESIREYHIALVGRNRREGITFGIDIHTENPSGIGVVVEELLGIVLSGRNKVYEITMELLEEASYKRTFVKGLEEVEKQYKILEDLCVKKVMEDPRVKPLVEGRNLIVFPDMNLFLELETEYGSKILVGAFHFYFHEVLRFIRSLSEELIRGKQANRVLGYELLLDIDDLEISDIDITKDEVLVDLAVSDSKNLESNTY